jgi:hypothetical protein
MNIAEYFGSFVEKIQASLKSDKNQQYVTRRHDIGMIISHSIFLRMRVVAGKRCREHKSTQNMFSKPFLIVPFMR